LNALPNVQSTTIASYSPMQGTSTNSTITIRGYTPAKTKTPRSTTSRLDQIFRDAGCAATARSDIGLEDTPNSPQVAVVNQAFVKSYFPMKPDWPARHFRRRSDKDDFEIVGVIADSKYDNAKEKAAKAVFRPIMQVQDQQSFNNVFELRTSAIRWDLR